MCWHTWNPPKPKAGNKKKNKRDPQKTVAEAGSNSIRMPHPHIRHTPCIVRVSQPRIFVSTVRERVRGTVVAGGGKMAAAVGEEVTYGSIGPDARLVRAVTGAAPATGPAQLYCITDFARRVLYSCAGKTEFPLLALFLFCGFFSAIFSCEFYFGRLVFAKAEMNKA